MIRPARYAVQTALLLVLIVTCGSILRALPPAAGIRSVRPGVNRPRVVRRAAPSRAAIAAWLARHRFRRAVRYPVYRRRYRYAFAPRRRVVAATHRAPAQPAHKAAPPAPHPAAAAASQQVRAVTRPALPGSAALPAARNSPVTAAELALRAAANSKTSAGSAAESALRATVNSRTPVGSTPTAPVEIVKPAPVAAAKPQSAPTNLHAAARPTPTAPLSAITKVDSQSKAPAAGAVAVALHTSSAQKPAVLTPAKSGPAAGPVKPGMQTAGTVQKQPAPAAKPTAAAVSSTRGATSGKPTAAASASKPGETILTETKPDAFAPIDTSRDHTMESPLQVVGEGWKMIGYLLPTLVLILAGLGFVRRYQQKHGKLPGVVQAAARASAAAKSAGPAQGGFAALFGRRRAAPKMGLPGQSIQVLESVSMGTATLHLVEVRGKVLLLGGNPTGVSILTEFEERSGTESEVFRAMLQSAAADMDGLDLSDSDMPVTAVAGSLDDVVRDTRESVARRIRRLRTVQEAEESEL